jgi:hypothetical protein
VSQDGTYASPEKIAISKEPCASDRVRSNAILRNDAGTRAEIWHKSDTAGSANVHDLTPENENPGALVGATGALSIGQKIKSQEHRKPGRSAMSLYGKDRHKRAAKMLGYALTLDDDPTIWTTTSAIWARRLTSTEFASIAYAALSALEPADREMTFNAAHWGAV